MSPTFLPSANHVYDWEYISKDWGSQQADLAKFKGIDVKKRTVTTYACSLLYGIRFGHYMGSCLFSFNFIGPILAYIKIAISALNFLVTFLLLTTNTAL